MKFQANRPKKQGGAPNLICNKIDVQPKIFKSYGEGFVLLNKEKTAKLISQILIFVFQMKVPIHCKDKILYWNHR